MVTRRKFLKGGAAVSVGSVYYGSLTSLLTGVPSQAIAAEHITIREHGLMVADPRVCVGCRRCEIGCSWSHEQGDVSPTYARVKIEANMLYGPSGVHDTYHNRQGQMGDRTIVPATCRQCDTCMDACNQDAISVNEKTGAKIVDPDKCIGCGVCVKNCPQDVIVVDHQRHLALKCDLCDGAPNCAQMCPTGAIRFYTWEQADEALANYENFMQSV
ncbi:4Fe-4S dicluster domain-containing protein [Ferrimonas lipolytica]|uniref:4Fe-4S dicluster domain-containing protein n=1 Tax=Ferrimonas lipolytica TaxID=2724191 RepID=A0A6H1UDN9_9GAMM|nr:4Fe-4S dicluster domain-containing protein [Ferrimonas lipolytica]QIZ76958.1 4Fe-4S dicluster domain-containing protein [Ferrimonas lipolytica]